MPTSDFNSAGQLNQLEHDPTNHAKRVDNYVWNTDTGLWERMSTGLQAGKDFDYVDVQQTNSTTETYVFKTGGSSGTTVQTIVVVYTSSAKSDIDTVTWS
jgi:hypothetical protein